MADISPIAREQADETLKSTYQQLIDRFGRVPNFYATMAHCPEVLNQFMPFYDAVMNTGQIERFYKELAYLRVSVGNACAY